MVTERKILLKNEKLPVIYEESKDFLEKVDLDSSEE